MSGRRRLAAAPRASRWSAAQPAATPAGPPGRQCAALRSPRRYYEGVNNLFLLLAIVAGAGVTIQAIVNARLGAAFGAPIWGAMTQFVVGLTILLLAAAVTRQPAPNTSTVGQLPWWMWTGGLFGALFIFATVYLTPKFGAALTMSCAIVGQLTAAVLI